LRGLEVVIGHHHLRASGGQLPAHGLADAGRAAGDDRDLAREILRHAVSPCPGTPWSAAPAGRALIGISPGPRVGPWTSASSAPTKRRPAATARGSWSSGCGRAG